MFFSISMFPFSFSFFFFFLACTVPPSVEALSPNHWTSRKFPISVSFLNLANCYRPFFTQACKHINNLIYLCLVASVVSDSLEPYGLDCKAPLSTEFSRQEYWRVSHALLQGILIFLTQGLNPHLSPLLHQKPGCLLLAPSVRNLLLFIKWIRWEVL